MGLPDRLKFSFRPSTRSLKTTLAVYFLPISIIPAIFISYYAIQLFEESSKQGLSRRAQTDRDVIVNEIENSEDELMSLARSHARQPQLKQAFASKNARALSSAIAGFRSGLDVRLYSIDGKFLEERRSDSEAKLIPYISSEGLKRLKARGETQDRYFLESGIGFITVTRVLVKDNHRLYGVLEELQRFGEKQLSDLKNRRQVDIVFLNRDFTSVAGSFALSKEILKSFSSRAFQQGTMSPRVPIFVELGDARYAGFLFDMPGLSGKNRQWGYLAIFISMTAQDATIAKLKLALAYLTAFLTLVAALLIFVFSNRLVKPIEVLVSAMKRIKTGRVEQIPPIDSTYEIEYLVRSFNEMARNVSAAKRTLELKLEELHRANLEIKETQAHLVQSAKMASIGQIVAGVAHELNNPIGFIYSNMHHLSQYVEKFNELVRAYRALYDKLPKEAKTQIQKLEHELEIDYVLKDMSDLTQSCLEGANRTKEIVLGLRTFSRMDEFVFKPIDLHEGVRSSLRLLASELKDRITVHLELAELPLVECSISQINQVLVNLISNAAQAIPAKGDIWIRTKVVGDKVHLEVQDNGAGMNKETQEKIFDPFFTTKKIGQGTGLGLSIAYGLIQKHQGSIVVESQPGKGSLFTIILPIRQTAAA